MVELIGYICIWATAVEQRKGDGENAAGPGGMASLVDRLSPKGAWWGMRLDIEGHSMAETIEGKQVGRQ